MFEVTSIAELMSRPIEFCEKCKFPKASLSHEYDCDRLAKEWIEATEQKGD